MLKVIKLILTFSLVTESLALVVATHSKEYEVCKIAIASSIATLLAIGVIQKEEELIKK